MTKVETSDSFIVALVKGFVLVAWTLALLGLSLLAVSGRASDVLLDISHSLAARAKSTTFMFSGSCVGALEGLTLYIAGRESPPPIQSVLDNLAPTWTSAYLCPTNDKESATDTPAKYHKLFVDVDEYLRSLVEQPHESSEPYFMPLDLFPPEVVGGPKTSQSLQLPQSARTWIERERRRLANRGRQLKLLDTFVLLAVIGAFGSLVFMIREYVADSKRLSIRAYVFRPVLGVFMAIALFALAALTHAVVSSGSILEIRSEPLYVLALAAGLLSERAYAAVESRAGKIIDEHRRSNKTSRSPPVKESEPVAGTEERETG